MYTAYIFLGIVKTHFNNSRKACCIIYNKHLTCMNHISIFSWLISPLSAITIQTFTGTDFLSKRVLLRYPLLRWRRLKQCMKQQNTHGSWKSEMWPCTRKGQFWLYRSLNTYEGCSNMNASSFITFFTYMLRQNGIPFWKELCFAFKMAPNIKKHSLYLFSYIALYKGHSCILKFFWS